MRKPAAGKPSIVEDTARDEVLSTIARSVAYLAMHAAELASEDLATKAEFMGRLGLSRVDCARVLETTAETLRVAASRRKKSAPRRRQRA